MIDGRLEIKVRLTPTERTQWERDASLIKKAYGTLPNKHLVLMAVHRWASQIRTGCTDEIDAWIASKRAK